MGTYSAAARRRERLRTDAEYAAKLKAMRPTREMMNRASRRARFNRNMRRGLHCLFCDVPIDRWSKSGLCRPCLLAFGMKNWKSRLNRIKQELAAIYS